MGGLMNNYFYGKAGKGDYTVEQMPTTRKQLFFTTLRVRLSSMMGLNLLHVLFVLPLIAWVFLSFQTVMLYSSDEAYLLGGEDMQKAYHEFSAYKTQYEAIENANENATVLNNELNGVLYNISEIEKGNKPTVTEAAIVEGGEPTVRELTMEELTIKKAELEKKIQENNALLETTPEAKEELRQKYYDAAVLYDAHLNSATKSQVSMALLVMIPLMGLAGIGSTGQMYVLRNWARDEHSFMWQDFKSTIKSNWKQGLVVGLFNGLSLFLCYIAYVTYGDMARTNGQFFIVPQMLMIVLLAVWWMMNEIIFPMMITYDMKVSQLIRNSAIMVIARLPMSLLILVGSMVPAVIALCLPIQISMIVLILFYGLIGFSLTGFVYASYANSCFDRYLNPRIEGAEVNKGLREADDDDDDEDGEGIKVSQPEVPVKEDRFWERKSK